MLGVFNAFSTLGSLSGGDPVVSEEGLPMRDQVCFLVISQPAWWDGLRIAEQQCSQMQ